ncbi:hypothetical protein [Undibacterium sp. WLHG33]|uniref:hypothetical protein n=1 Tax=Undibacterium sp. WLHG33 TaxID=3412482 RepID=UPI003C2B86F5
MESIKISLADAAQKRGCSADYLLALAEAEQLDVFARLQPFTAKMGTYPHKTDIYDNQTRSTATHEYTTLLPAQIQALRAGRQIEIKVMRPEDFENGYSILSLSEEPLLYWLDNPQQIGIESIFLNWRDEPKQTDNISKETPPQTVPAPITEESSYYWFDEVMDATYWWNLPSVTVEQATMLLMCINPNETTKEDAELISTDETKPQDFKKILTAFKALRSENTQLRKLSDWSQEAKKLKLKTHSWFEKWESFHKNAMQAINISSSTTSIQNGISTSEVITAFESITNHCNLKKVLADKPKWIAVACLDRGLKGVRQGTWNPVILAIALRDKQYSQKTKLTKAFYEHKFLSDWRDEWEEKSDY